MIACSRVSETHTRRKFCTHRVVANAQKWRKFRDVLFLCTFSNQKAMVFLPYCPHNRLFKFRSLITKGNFGVIERGSFRGFLMFHHFMSLSIYILASLHALTCVREAFLYHGRYAPQRCYFIYSYISYVIIL